jgi:hypothetical protein
MLKNMAEPGRPRMKIRRMRFACWVTKATDKHPEYVILIAVYANNGYANAPEYYDISNLPLFFCTNNMKHIKLCGKNEEILRASRW